MAEVPFLGCKISLISKCDIRYEGILYCVDPKESTIALSKVKSYGTETRGDPSNYVAPKNDVYDIIIFRASDVKDLRVDAPEPPGLSDPAIISARQSNTAFEGINNGSLPTSSGPSQEQQQQQQQTSQKPLLPFLPTSSGPSQDHQQTHQKPLPHKPLPAGSRRMGGNERRDNNDGRRGEDNRRGDDTRRGDDVRPSRMVGNERRDNNDGRRNDGVRPTRMGGNDRRDNNNDGRRGEDGRPNRMGRGGYDRNHVNSHSRYNNNTNNYNNHRRGPNNYRDHENSKGSNYRRGGYQGNRRGRSGDRAGAPRGPRKSAPLKFEGEYDFDKANQLFLELDGKFKGLKIKNGGKEDGAESSGERAESKSPAGGSDSGSNYEGDDHNNKDGDSKDGCEGSVSGDFYDKTKSFFDNISCEASERSQGKVNKPDWRKERQLNSETFGVSANYRRGGYRGYRRG